MPEDSNTKLLMHFDNNVEDAMGLHTPVVGDNAPTFSSSIKVFGSHSGLFPGLSPDTVDIPDHNDFEFGGGEFLLDARIRFVSLPGSLSFDRIINKGNGTTGFQLWTYNNFGTRNLRFSIGGNTYSATWSPSTDTWYHMTAVRSGDLLYLHVDGSAIINGEDLSGVSQATGSDPVSLMQGCNGYMDEFRLVKGSDGNWGQASITVPSEAYEAPSAGGLGSKVFMLNQ